MKVLCWRNNQGPAMVFLMPEDGMPVDHAAIPGGPWGRPWSDLAAKGRAISWPDFAQALTERPPYLGRWSLEEVPDGRDAQQALAVICGRELGSLALGKKPSAG
jgi:hypothetical protein